MKTITLPPKDRQSDIDRIVLLMQSFELGKPVNVRLSIARPERSIPELRYLHGVPYRILADAMGYEPDEIAEYLLGCFYGWKEKNLPGGRVESKPLRTTTKDEEGNRDVITGEEFWRYVSWIQRVAARHGVIVPDPDPSHGINRV